MQTISFGKSAMYVCFEECVWVYVKLKVRASVKVWEKCYMVKERVVEVDK